LFGFYEDILADSLDTQPYGLLAVLWILWILNMDMITHINVPSPVDMMDSMAQQGCVSRSRRTTTSLNNTSNNKKLYSISLIKVKRFQWSMVDEICTIVVIYFIKQIMDIIMYTH
jgi:hypothetical protein